MHSSLFNVPGGKPCIYRSRAKVSPQPANQSAKQSAPLREDRYVKLPGAEGAQSKLKLAESEKKWAKVGVAVPARSGAPWPRKARRVVKRWRSVEIGGDGTSPWCSDFTPQIPPKKEITIILMI